MASKDTDTALSRLARRLNVQDQSALRTQSNSSAPRMQLDSPAFPLDDDRQIRIVLLGKTGVGMNVLVY